MVSKDGDHILLAKRHQGKVPNSGLLSFDSVEIFYTACHIAEISKLGIILGINNVIQLHPAIPRDR